MMSAPRLSSAAQLRYMLQWFEEWSELQRQDFLPLLAEKMATRVYVDAITNHLASVNCHNKPLSLFQCRIKLFNEWYPTWGEDERSRLVQGVTNIDPGFGSKLQEQIDTANHPVNGITNGVHNEEDEEPNLPSDPSTNPLTPTDENDREGLEEREQHNEDVIVQENVQENQMPLEIAATS